MGRWMWPLGVFVAAFLGGVIVAVLGVRAVIAADARRDSMLYEYLSVNTAAGDVKTRLSTIRAAQLGDLDEVVRLNCAFMREGRSRMSIVLHGAVDPHAYDGQMREVDAKIAELRAAGKCGR